MGRNGRSERHVAQPRRKADRQLYRIPDAGRDHERRQRLAGLDENDDGDRVGTCRREHARRERAEPPVPLEERCRRIGEETDGRQGRQTPEDEDALAFQPFGDVQYLDRDRRDEERDDGQEEPEGDREEKGGDQQPTGVLPVVPRTVDREVARERRRDASVEGSQRAQDDDGQRPDPEAVEAEPVEQERRERQRDHHRRDLRETVEADVARELGPEPLPEAPKRAGA